jgi:hypothetical protein
VVDLSAHRYRFTAPLWEWDGGPAAWHFITLPEEVADEIKAITEGTARRGFGSVRVEVAVGPSRWSTSIFPSKETGSYLLPVKKDVRHRAGIEAGDDVAVDLRLAALPG